MKLAAAVAVTACWLAACRAPWTIRRLDAEESDTGARRPFDAAAFVASIWDSKVIPSAAAAPDYAVGARGLVKGTAKVLRIDAARQRLVVDLAPFDARPDAELAVGQIRGTALRDALPFIQFSQFVNQVDYAHAANALNERAAAVASSAMAGIAPGAVVRFAGALDPPMDGLPAEIIPVMLSVAGERP
jgi:predicted lipoprotein